MEPTLPTWFKYRQGKTEPAGENTYRLTAPNQQEAYVGIRKADNGKWVGLLRQTADGPELAVSAPGFEAPDDAWQAAFELYRQHILV
jgi:hypothetical protein